MLKRKSSGPERETAKKQKYSPKKDVLDLNNLDFNYTYSLKEYKLIMKHLKVHSNYELVNGKIIPIQYTPIANEAVVHEIARQLGNWNIKYQQNGLVTTSQGGFNFSNSNKQKIRAPDIAFTPMETCLSLDDNQLWSFKGQPFTPNFVVEVANLENNALEKIIDTKIKKDYFAMNTSVKLGWLIDPKNCVIWVYKRNKHNQPYRYKHKWEDLDGGDILPRFTLKLTRIENIVSQNLEEEKSDDEGDKCSYCNKIFTNVHEIIKHLEKEHT
ncbi:putative restriction endonuclease-domain-containing protein [Glomus cerebriforme]|uniref:Putative restriction endonuclease-domain-containing protein n=1 Tax=Glomus cerebriforme TaxID=658196 RepID=A0A397TID2_9GLOM|nr:putative restriction endonuclease-domain-containing protein [Glomus cerebriforme]